MAVKYHDITDQSLIARISTTKMSVVGDKSLPVHVRGSFIFMIGASQHDADRDVMKHSLSLGEFKKVAKIKSSEDAMKQLSLLKDSGWIEVTINDDQVSYRIPLKQEKEVTQTDA